MHIPHTEPATHAVLWKLSWNAFRLAATAGWLCFSGGALAAALIPVANPKLVAVVATVLFLILTALPTLIISFHPRFRTAAERDAAPVYMRTLVQPAIPGLVFAAALIQENTARLSAAFYPALTLGLFPLLPPIIAAWYAYRRTVHIQLHSGRAPSYVTWLILYAIGAACWYNTWLLVMTVFLIP